MVPIFALYSRDFVSHGGIVVTEQFNPNLWDSVTLFSEWNLMCQQGALNILCGEPYGFWLKRRAPNHWNISANKRTIAVAWQQY